MMFQALIQKHFDLNDDTLCNAEQFCHILWKMSIDYSIENTSDNCLVIDFTHPCIFKFIFRCFCVIYLSFHIAVFLCWLPWTVWCLYWLRFGWIFITYFAWILAADFPSRELCSEISFFCWLCNVWCSRYAFDNL